MTVDSSSFEPTIFNFSPSELRKDWLGYSGMLPNVDTVLDVLNETGVVSFEMFSDVIDLLVPVALVENYICLDVVGENTIQEEARQYLGQLMNDDLNGKYAMWRVGVCMSFLDNLVAEEKRFVEVAMNIITDPNFSGTEDARFEIASIVAGETDEVLPKDFANDFVPTTSVEKVNACRELVMESDVEGFMLNFARNLVLVEDVNTHDSKKLRAAINIVEILVPMTRMFGSRFKNISERAWQSAWEFIQTRNPEITENVGTIHEHAELIQESVGELIHSWLSDTDAKILFRRIKDSGSTILKKLRKGAASYDDVADMLGYRVVAKDRDDLEHVLKNMISAFKFKNGAYKLETNDFIVELGRQCNNTWDEISHDNSSAIVLDIKNADKLYDSLGRPPKMFVGKPKDSGFETVYLNLIIRKKGGNPPINCEIQIVTEEMLKSNKIGKAVIAVYKLNPSSTEDMRRAVEMVQEVRQRTDVFANDQQKLTLKTQFRMLEYWPEIDTVLSEIYRVVTVDEKLVVLPREVAEFMPNIDFSEKFKKQAINLTVIPVAKVSEQQFIKIIESEMPSWFNGKSKLYEALRLANKWHSGQKRRSGTNHYEGHILPLTLAYYLNMAARAEEVSQDDLISILLHDSVEDAESFQENSSRIKTIHRLFGIDVLHAVVLQTKQVKHKYETADELDSNQAARLLEVGGKIGQVEAIKKSIDRAGSHIGDLTVGIAKGELKPRYESYFANTKKHYSTLFEKDPIAQAIWLAMKDVFSAVMQKIG